MFVYLFNVAYTTPEQPRPQVLRVVAPDVKSAIAVAEERVAGATVMSAPAGMPVDAIADGIIVANIDLQPMPSNAAQQQPMARMAQGAMMMPGGQMM